MISVIIPTFNRSTVIERSIRSVLNQSIGDLEIIVVDDNSNDNTEDIVKSIQDDRIKFVKLEQNKGACYARNEGIKRASGRYIAFQDSDDEWYINKLEIQLKYLEKKKLDVVACKVLIKSEDREYVFPKNINVDSSNIYMDNFITTQTILAKKECLINEPFDNDLPRFQDWDLAIRLVNKYKVEVIDKVLVNVYHQENSISKSREKAIEALEIFLDKHSKNNKIESKFLRSIGVYNMSLNRKYKRYFIKSFLKIH